MTDDIIAAVDLGSNSFRLQVARISGDQIYPMDSLKESVRLAAGLTADKHLDEAAQRRGLEALALFAERLRGFEPDAVRAVGTNTLRVAKNASQFLEKAEATLGFPIEVIAGREEARLIYLGVIHTLPNLPKRQLVVDIGGGSTEFIIGDGVEPICLDSLYMGCVSYSLRFFPDGQVDKRGFKDAELAARRELQGIVRPYRLTGWDVAIGSSGTVKAISELMVANRLSDGEITREGLDDFRAELIRAGSAAQMRVQGMREDRVVPFPGGLAILSAIFKEFGLDRMLFSEGALRLGVLYDQLGRIHHEDLREVTVKNFMRRYHVDAAQAERVERTAIELLKKLLPAAREEAIQVLAWAARLHEIGISVAHSSYHKHSAYILANADMPGFSKRDQARLARLVLAHRGKLERARPQKDETLEWTLLFCLRIAVLLNKSRDDKSVCYVTPSFSGKGFELRISAAELEDLPLTEAALEDEAKQWAEQGGDLKLLRGD